MVNCVKDIHVKNREVDNIMDDRQLENQCINHLKFVETYDLCQILD